MEEIPIIIDGSTCGQLQLQRQGAYVLCTGWVQGRYELLRLWLYGTGAPAYLGVLIPDGGGGSSVRKKLSLREFEALPKPITHCGPEGENGRREAAPTHEVRWISMGDGTLKGQIGGQWYLAFPAEGAKFPRGGQRLLRRIEGNVYMIFPC